MRHDSNGPPCQGGWRPHPFDPADLYRAHPRPTRKAEGLTPSANRSAHHRCLLLRLWCAPVTPCMCGGRRGMCSARACPSHLSVGYIAHMSVCLLITLHICCLPAGYIAHILCLLVTCTYVCLSVTLHICVSVCRLHCTSACLTVGYIADLSVCLSVTLHICLSVCRLQCTYGFCLAEHAAAFEPPSAWTEQHVPLRDVIQHRCACVQWVVVCGCVRVRNAFVRASV